MNLSLIFHCSAVTHNSAYFDAINSLSRSTFPCSTLVVGGVSGCWSAAGKARLRMNLTSSVKGSIVEDMQTAKLEASIGSQDGGRL